MKVLVTGAAGFIGFHVSNKYLENGWDVVGIDSLNDYYDPSLKEERARILKERGATFLEMNVLYIADMEETDFDLVVHLAAYAGVRYSMSNPLPYITNNIEGTQELITWCEDNMIENVIYASTSCVMHGHDIPWDEKEIFHKQINPYGYSKMVNESQFHISNIKNAIGLRFFTVYGPWGRPDMALFDFTKNILAGNPITLFNNGNMKRDFTYVDDIVEGIWIVSQNMSSREIYCIGNGEQVQLEEFVDAIEDTLGVKAIREYGPLHPADVVETWSDTTKLQKLGYESKTPIKEGVAKFVEWYRGYYA